MVYLFAGNDFKKKYLNYENFIAGLPEGVATFFIGKNEFNQVQFENFYSSSSLFSSKCVIFLENIFEEEENLNFILEKLDLIKESQNDFVFLEGEINKNVLDAFRKARAELNIFELPKIKKEKYDSFQLAWAFADRDKLRLWVCFRQAMELGVAMEELIGVLFWKAKDLLLKKDFKKFSESELKNFANKLSYLLPKARKEGRDAESAFEQFLLEAF